MSAQAISPARRGEGEPALRRLSSPSPHWGEGRGEGRGPRGGAPFCVGEEAFCLYIPIGIMSGSIERLICGRPRERGDPYSQEPCLIAGGYGFPLSRKDRRRHGGTWSGHPRLCFTAVRKTWMAVTSTAMTIQVGARIEHSQVTRIARRNPATLLFIRRRPRESGDPYPQEPWPYRRGLWIPAFAGKTGDRHCRLDESPDLPRSAALRTLLRRSFRQGFSPQPRSRRLPVGSLA